MGNRAAPLWRRGRTVGNRAAPIGNPSTVKRPRYNTGAVGGETWVTGADRLGESAEVVGITFPRLRRVVTCHNFA